MRDSRIRVLVNLDRNQMELLSLRVVLETESKSEKKKKLENAQRAYERFFFLLKFVKPFNGNSEWRKKIIRGFSKEGSVTFSLVFLASFLNYIKFYFLNFIYIKF